MKGKRKDPVPHSYAAEYAAASYGQTGNQKELDEIIARMGGTVKGWRVLDLGGGPGQFTALLAKAGAQVVWHDISEHYKQLASGWCKNNGVEVEFQIGELEDLARYPAGSFDLVFNRVCWYYAKKEVRLYAEIKRIVRPGGWTWVHTHASGRLQITFNPISWLYYLLYLLHESLGLKLAHVPARSQRLKRWFFEAGDYRERYFHVDNRNVYLLGQRTDDGSGS